MTIGLAFSSFETLKKIQAINVNWPAARVNRYHIASLVMVNLLLIATLVTKAQLSSTASTLSVGNLFVVALSISYIIHAASPNVAIVYIVYSFSSRVKVRHAIKELIKIQVRRLNYLLYPAILLLVVGLEIVVPAIVLPATTDDLQIELVSMALAVSISLILISFCLYESAQSELKELLSLAVTKKRTSSDASKKRPTIISQLIKGRQAFFVQDPTQSLPTPSPKIVDDGQNPFVSMHPNDGLSTKPMRLIKNPSRSSAVKPEPKIIEVDSMHPDSVSCNYANAINSVEEQILPEADAIKY